MKPIFTTLFLFGTYFASAQAQSFQLIDKETSEPLSNFSLLVYFDSQAIKIDGRENGTIKLEIDDLKMADSIYLRHNFQTNLLSKDLFKQSIIYIDTQNQLDKIYVSNTHELNHYGIEKGNHIPHGYLQNKIIALKIPGEQINKGQIISMNIQFNGKNMYMKHELKGRTYHIVIGYELKNNDTIQMLYYDKEAVNVISKSKSQWVEIDLWDQDLYLPEDIKSIYIGVEPLEKHTMFKTAKRSDYPETEAGFIFYKDEKWKFFGQEYTSLPNMYITVRS